MIMDFKELDQEELQDLTAFFLVDVVAVDEDNPTKNELLAALTAADGNDEGISDEDYETYKLGKKNEAEAPKVEESTDAPVGKPNKWDDVDKSDWVLLKFEGKNPRIDLLGFTFAKKHPFQQVPPSVAEHAVRKAEGFRLAVASELDDFYN